MLSMIDRPVPNDDNDDEEKCAQIKLEQAMIYEEARLHCFSDQTLPRKHVQKIQSCVGMGKTKRWQGMILIKAF